MLGRGGRISSHRVRKLSRQIRRIFVTCVFRNGVVCALRYA